MKRYKIISLLVLLVICLCLVASCRNDSVNNESTTAPGSTSDEITEKTSISLTKENISSFTIVRPEKCDSAVVSAASSLKLALGECGLDIKIKDDWARKEEDVPTDTNEILIGITNRSESQEYSSGLKCDDYVIAATPSRIIILGGSGSATQKAVEFFIKNYLSDNEPTLTLNVGVISTYTGEYKRADITLFDKSISEYEIVIPNNADAITKHAANIIANKIREESGHLINIANEKNASSTPHIKLLYSSDNLSDDEYSFEKDESGLTVRAGKRTLLYASRELISSLSNENQGNASITPELKVKKMSLPSYPLHSSLDGKTPVAMCDQLNKKAVIFDLDAKDPTSKDAVIWEWVPNGSNGFSGAGFNYQIDDIKLRYSEILNTYIICVTSSGGFMGIAEYPSGRKIWETNASGYGPHSIDYLPSGLVACALSGNGNTEKNEIRLYYNDKNGNLSSKYISDELVSAHGVHWDNEFGVLWALGGNEIVAYEISGSPEQPVMTRIEGFGGKISAGGHDLSADPNQNGIFWFSNSSVNHFNKYENKVISNFDGRNVINAKSVKCICVLPDGRILRTAATNVFKSHNTDTLAVFTKNESGTFVKTEYVFSDRAFYKARAFYLH